MAAFAGGSAALAPVRGRLVDRRGPRALLVLAPLHAVGFVLVIVGCAGPAWAPVAAAGLAGAVVPPVIATARAAWVEVAGPELAPTAHALNAALGDVAAVAGPALTGATAALLSPLAALAVLIPGAATAALLVALPGRREARAALPPAARPSPPAAAALPPPRAHRRRPPQRRRPHRPTVSGGSSARAPDCGRWRCATGCSGSRSARSTSRRPPSPAT